MEPEKYLIKEYSVVYDKKYLKIEDDIKDYFKDNAYDYFDCGQGYYQDEAEIICMTQDGKFYKVKIVAEIISAKQDRGDRLYWVERIDSVNYNKIDKPKEKTKDLYLFSWVLTEGQKTQVEKFVNKLIN